MPVHKQIHKNFSGLSKSATLVISERSNALVDEGRDIFKFGLGQSPFPVPQVVVDSLKDNAHQKDYLPVVGLFELREQVAKYYNQMHGLNLKTEGVLIGPGSKELLFIAQFVYQAELLIPNPSWVSYEPQAVMAGNDVKWLETKYEDRWLITAETLEKTCSKDPKKPRILILNYPSNPSGQTLSFEDLKAIAKVARKYGVLVLSDEIYGELTHSGSHDSIAKYYPEGTIVSGGLSKWAGAGGWRLGCFLMPKELDWLFKPMSTFASETFSAVSAPIQWAAVTAYSPDKSIETYLEHSRAILAELGSRLHDILTKSGIKVHKPQGGFYLMPDFSNHKKKISSLGINGSVELCEWILNQSGVAILPGTVFGRPSAELFARMAYVNFDGAKALADLGAGMSVSEVVETNCARTIEATKCLGNCFD
jgi:aspartate aminotransferase